MQLVIMRHGTTSLNEERRYAGASDVPLSDAGVGEARAAGVVFGVAAVYTSPLLRARETASICFPGARQVIVDDLAEMNFGAFEGRSADEMADDEDYRAWVDGMCEGKCPGGESRAEFVARVSAALGRILREADGRGEDLVVVVAHGGTVMCAMDAFSHDDRGYFSWRVGNCEGYSADVVVSRGSIELASIAHFDNLSFLAERGLAVDSSFGDGPYVSQPSAACAAYEPHTFFQNRACKYFPCHEGVSPEQFNCLFCYCPLYALGPSCGGDYTYTSKGRKNCTGCARPHVGDAGARMVKERFADLADLAARP